MKPDVQLLRKHVMSICRELYAALRGINSTEYIRKIRVICFNTIFIMFINNYICKTYNMHKLSPLNVLMLKRTRSYCKNGENVVRVVFAVTPSRLSEYITLSLKVIFN